MISWPDNGGLFPEGQVEEPEAYSEPDPEWPARLREADTLLAARAGLEPVRSLAVVMFLDEVRAACAEQKRRVAERRAKPWL